MAGFLDKNAPSPEAEYSRYLDGDILGKMLAKNFLVNRIGYPVEKIAIPLGRYGDSASKYSDLNSIVVDPGDGYIETEMGFFSFEIKCARINIANRHKSQVAENWAFNNILKSPAKAAKKFDILIAIGVQVLGLEDERYWEHLQNSRERILKAKKEFSLNVQAHESDFLNVCGFLVIPFDEIKTNHIRLTLPAIPKSPYYQYFSPGTDSDRCSSIWEAACKKKIPEVGS